MESHVKLFGHPVHPMLIVLPMGLLATAVIFDIIYLFADNDAFPTVSFWNIAAGIVGGLLAAIFGLWDWLNIPADTRAKRIGLMHGGGNVVVLALFAASWLLRLNEPGYETSGLALGLAVVGVLLALVTGWLGGELIDRLGVGIDRGANLDAPNSLSGRPASDDTGVGSHPPATRR